MSQLTADENAIERLRWTRLVQTYVPIRADGSGTILASAEFYQLPDALDAEVGAARLRAWEVVLLAAVASYLLVGFVVQRAASTIGRQRQRLLDQVEELSSLFHEVTNLNERLHVAAAQTIEVATQERRRISADMHDGPIQAMALAMLRLESFEDSEAQPGHDDPRIGSAHEAIRTRSGELRQIAAGLRLPDLAPLSVGEVIHRAVDYHERRSLARVETDVVDLAVEAPLAVKIALFRGLEEGLSNATRHGQGVGLAVHASREDGLVHVEIADGGPGFKPDAPRSGGLGLTGMEERAALLGGSFAIDSQPGAGTRVRITLPLEEPRTVDPRALAPESTPDAGSPA